MKKAWVENGIVRDICSGNPDELYHHDVAKLYSVSIPDEAENGDGFAAGTLTKPIKVAYVPPEPVITFPKLSPMQFKMCFKSAERIAIKAIRTTDPIIEDAFDLLEDTRLTEVDMALKSNQDLIDYLVYLTILTTERAAQIKAGIQL